MSDESGDISGITVASLKERLTEILEGFNKKDVYNLDETGCFWRALPQLDLWRKAKSVKEVKKVSNASQLRLWLNAVGEKEQPIVIWKSANPRCFRGFDKRKLPVKYYSQNKA